MMNNNKLISGVFLAVGFLGVLSGCSSMGSSGFGETPQVGQGPVVVTIPSELDLLSVDGAEVDAPSLMSGDYVLNVSEGQHRLELRYLKNWNTQDEVGYLVEWRPVLIDAEFLDSKAYRVEYREPSNREEASDWQNTPEIWLTDEASEIARVDGELAPEKPTMIERMLDTSPAPTAASAAVGSTGTARASIPANDGDSAVVTGLKFYWSQSSDAERKEFLEWVEQSR